MKKVQRVQYRLLIKMLTSKGGELLQTLLLHVNCTVMFTCMLHALKCLYSVSCIATFLPKKIAMIYGVIHVLNTGFIFFKILFGPVSLILLEV